MVGWLGCALTWIAVAVAQDDGDLLPPPAEADPAAVGGLDAGDVVPEATLVAPIAEALRDRPVAAIIRGGASLGSYEAGYLYALTRALKAERGPGAPFDVVTGASAGALNTILTAVAGCQVPVDRPEDSLFWTWTRVHIDPAGRSRSVWNLYRRDEVTATSAFVRQPFVMAAETVRTAMDDPDRWLAEPCEVDLGFVVSRLRARRVPIRQDTTALTAQRQTEKIVVRLQRRVGAAPTFFPVIPRGPDGELSASRPLYLHLGKGDPHEPVPFDDVFAVLAASSGVPFAFQEIAIPHREWDLEGRLITGWQTENARFVDGGLLENLPVRLATTVAKWRRWEGRDTSPARSYLVIDPEVETWERAEGRRRFRTPTFEPDAVRLGMELASSYVRSAQDAELLLALDEDPQLMRAPSDPDAPGASRDRLLLPGRRTVPASQWFGAFLGLFEESFRVFDFHLGMLEARAEVNTVLQAPARVLEPGAEQGIDSAVFACFVAWDEATEGFVHTLERSAEPASCAPYDREDDPVYGDLLPLLRAATAYRVWSASDAYVGSSSARFALWVEMLADAGFRWRTFTSSPRVEDIERQLRRFMLRASSDMAAEQGGNRRLLFAFGSRLAVNTVAYRPPDVLPFVGLSLGWGGEVGVGFAAGRWVRPVVGFRALDIGRRVDTGADDPFSVALSPMLRVDFTPMSTPVFSVEPWAQYAPQLPITFAGELMGSRHVLSGGIHLVGFEWVYLTLGGGGVLAEEAYGRFEVPDLSRGGSRFVLDLSLGLRVPI